uniref:Uncharacterized protein n=2 Tax=Vannella robusta TaxID=1487602 RepID=A0A7S4IW80_9EUKA
MDAWVSLLVALLLVVVASVLFFLRGSSKKKVPQEPVEEKETPVKAKKKPGKNQKSVPTKPKQPQRESHKRYLCTLKNHTNEVVHCEFSPCGNYLATASEDRTLLLYKLKTIMEPSHPHRRVNILGDVPGRFCISIDGKYVVLSMQMTTQINVYGISSKGGKLLKQIRAQPHHKQPINAVDFSSNLKYMLSCSSTDTRINLWDIKGNVIHSFTTNQMSNQMARFSPDSKFIAIATISTETKLWELKEDKKGGFVSLEKAIQGSSSGAHSKTVTCLDFTSDSKQLVTGSMDGSWKLWNIDVNYKLNEDARCIRTSNEPNGKEIQYLRVSPNNQRLATVSNDTTIIMWDLTNGSIVDTIESAHDAKITAVSWSRNSDVLASSSEDTRVHLWNAKI